ncbi:MAG TPA: hypothetical protein VF507_05195, partial [Pyrinomonadaceae bacterium]
MEAEEIRQCLGEVDDELRAMNVKGEVCIYGGAVMCLVFDARPSTKDVDAVFRPAREMRQAAERVAAAHGLPGDWLNDAVKGYVVPHPRHVLFDFPNLKVFVPEPDYLLAMKALAARADAPDRSDIELLIKLLGLKKPEEVFSILEKYYPRRQIRPATQYFI